MSDLAASAVQLHPNPSDGEFYPFGTGDRTVITRRLKLTLTGQGTGTNAIGANALGLSRLLYSTNLWDAENSKGYPAVIDPVNNRLILLDGSAAPAPVDVTSNAAYVTVTGAFNNP